MISSVDSTWLSKTAGSFIRKYLETNENETYKNISIRGNSYL